jgi:hypothetical protein
LANDKWGQQICDAIASHDVAALRGMAAAADREETRMWLTLLARMLELDAGRKRRQRRRAERPVPLPAERRTKLRRAV